MFDVVVTHYVIKNMRTPANVKLDKLCYYYNIKKPVFRNVPIQKGF